VGRHETVQENVSFWNRNLVTLERWALQAMQNARKWAFFDERAAIGVTKDEKMKWLGYADKPV